MRLIGLLLLGIAAGCGDDSHYCFAFQSDTGGTVVVVSEGCPDTLHLEVNGTPAELGGLASVEWVEVLFSAGMISREVEVQGAPVWSLLEAGEASVEATTGPPGGDGGIAFVLEAPLWQDVPQTIRVRFSGWDERGLEKAGDLVFEIAWPGGAWREVPAEEG